ncbi:cyclic nucleotide-binding and patatin-like phospholipase domain-containing protein [Anaeromyxobacter terrae]|uniref:cyclic nucleotide-binding and patatin-like phospholipase domain-containing protein n=1 Tax=Anaeromyxobacter terrae TaxID=2925406 RepID=UPI001F5A48B1|nr:cyclic nucleotide-binding and patatin-like phospholipase domain-containing protein [Anaeromyxobacter sp. SG22]
MDSLDIGTSATGPPDRRGDVLGALRRERLAAHLVALFGSADTEIADDLLRLGEWVKVSGGDRLFGQGEPGDSMYIVVAGRLVALCADASGRERVVGQVRPGESVGEMGLLASQPRTATVQAVRDSVVVRISEQAFRQVIAKHPQLLAGAARLIIRRTTEMIRGRTSIERVKNIVIVPLRRSVAGSEFVERLRRALERRGRTLVIDRARADAVLSANGISPASGDDARDLVFSAWLDEEELRHESILYETERLSDAWTERCLRQADVVLMLAPSGEPPELHADEHRLARGDGHGERRELVLIHPPGAGPPAETDRWLAPRDVARHHHLRWDREDDFGRLARFLTGEAVGLVLGGGGARGFVHLGVIRALREAGIPIDAVGGTSQGAIAAAAVAMDWDDATIERLHRVFTQRNPIGDYSLFPHLALVKGKRLEDALQRSFGARGAEDTWRSFFCMSANLTLARPEAHRRGPLWKVLRASAAIPGILPPVVLGEHLHVDGALLDNMPVEAMRGSGVGRIVAVDLEVKREMRVLRGELPSVVDFLRERLRSGVDGPASPGLGSILFKSVMMSSTQRSQELRDEVDLLLSPEPAEIGFLEWKALDRAIELGYRYARRELARRDVRGWVEAAAALPGS